MKLFRIALAAAALTLGATPALAADFTGPRVDVHVGSDKVSTGDADAKGVTVGAELGYDVALTDNIIAGAFVGADVTSADFNAADFAAFKKVGVRRDLSVGARLGVKASDQTLLYGGVAYTNAALRSVETLGELKNTNDLDGYRLLTGVEVAVFENVALKGEYRWSDYQNGVTRNDFLVGASVRF